MRDLQVAEETIRLLLSAVQQSKDSIIITTGKLDPPEPKIVFVNPAFSEMTGYMIEEVLGKTPRLLQGPKTNRALLDDLRQHLSDGIPFHGKEINYHKDGTEFYIEWHITPIRKQKNKLSEAKLQEALVTIKQHAKRQAQLVDDLLDLSRIIQGKLTLNLTSVTLVTPIAAALETVRLVAEAKAIQIKTILDVTVGQVMGDAGRLQQVIWNLLANAIKFTPQGCWIVVELERVEGDVQIVVSDTGQGIHPDFLPFVFDRFRQEDSSITRQFGGLGLGSYSLCRGA